MSTPLLVLVSLAYLWTGLEQGYKKDWDWLGVWGSYALVNFFFIRLLEG